MSSSASSSSTSQDESSSSSSSDSAMQVEEEEEKERGTAPASAEQPAVPQDVPIMEAPTLSRSWAVRTAHVPIFTGGKITHSNTRCLVPLDKDDTEQDTSPSLNNDELSPVAFLLLPVGGDVALVNADRGTKLETVRGEDAVVADDEDEEEGVDADAITAYALSWNDKMIVTCSQNSLLRQYSINMSHQAASLKGQNELYKTDATRQIIKPVKTWGKSGHSLPVTEMQFHRSNIFLATASVDGSVRIWDVRGSSSTPFVTHVFRPVAGGYEGGGSGTLSVTALQWLPEITKLEIAVARDDGSIAIHNLRDTQQEHVVVLRDHVSAVTCMQWNEDHTFFVTTGRDAVVTLWRVSQAKSSTSAKKHKKKKKQGSNHNSLDAASVYDRLHTLPIYEQVEGMVILPQSHSRPDLVVATAGSKGRIRLWKAIKTDSKPRFSLLSEQPTSEAFGDSRGGYMGLCFNPNGHSTKTKDHEQKGQEQLIVADAEHNVAFMSVNEDQKTTLMTDRTIVGHNDDILDLKVIPSPDGEASRIVVATNSAQVRLFDLGNFSCDVLDRHSATVLCVDVSPCGRFIASCGKDKQMRVWHLDRQVVVATAIGHTEAIGSVAFSRKVGRYNVRGKAATNGGGAFVVTVSMDRTLKRWNLPGAAVLSELGDIGKESSLNASISVRAHDKDINIVAVAPNDSYIATGSQDKTVKLWGAADLSLVATLKGHRRGVWDCQFSPFDRVIATGSGDKTIKLWSLSDFTCVRTFQGHVASVLRVRFLSGGLQLVSSGADGLVKLWTIRTNECETTMDSHNDKVWALDLAGNGKSLISGGADSKIVVWEDTTKEEEAAKLADYEEAILLDQKLANHIRHKEYDEALEIALGRDKPHQTLTVLTAIIENDLQKGQNGLESLKLYAKKWSTDNLVRMLKYCREWNTRARNSAIALLTLKAIFSSFRADLLASTDGVPEILAGITPYAERHFDRLDRLCTSSYLLDYVLFSMGSIDDDKQEDELVSWQSSSRLVLPPKEIDGRTQTGGIATVGRYQPVLSAMNESDNEVVTIGDTSDDDDDSDDDSTAENS